MLRTTLLCLCAGFIASPAFSQERTNAFDDWGVYKADNPKECWVASKATKSKNTRSGKVVDVNRSDIYISVSWLPSAKVIGQVAFTGGYPFDPNFRINLKIGGNSWTLVQEGEHAWPSDSKTDTKIRIAMTKGDTAVVTAQSTRGTRTVDTFSLKGFTAALQSAKSLCGVS